MRVSAGCRRWSRRRRRRSRRGRSRARHRGRSSTEAALRGRGEFREIARQGFAGLCLELDLAGPARKARHLKPSHFGSNCQSLSSGSCSTSFASIGSMSRGTARAESDLGSVISSQRGRRCGRQRGGVPRGTSRSRGGSGNRQARQRREPRPATRRGCPSSLFGLISGVGGAIPRAAPLTVGDLAERGGQILEIGAYVVELVAKLVCIQLLQIAATLSARLDPNSSSTVLLKLSPAPDGHHNSKPSRPCVRSKTHERPPDCGGRSQFGKATLFRAGFHARHGLLGLGLGSVGAAHVLHVIAGDVVHHRALVARRDRRRRRTARQERGSRTRPREQQQRDTCA